MEAVIGEESVSSVFAAMLLPQPRANTLAQPIVERRERLMALAVVEVLAPAAHEAVAASHDGHAATLARPAVEFPSDVGPQVLLRLAAGLDVRIPATAAVARACWEKQPKSARASTETSGTSTMRGAR